MLVAIDNVLPRPSPAEAAILALAAVAAPRVRRGWLTRGWYSTGGGEGQAFDYDKLVETSSTPNAQPVDNDDYDI